MVEIDLLRSLPRTRRNVKARQEGKDPDVIAIAKQFGEMYWDGPRQYGYGGYKYDGRWRAVARDIIEYYGLAPGARVLDVGCGKGFLVKDLMSECPGLEGFGLDISRYALEHSPPELAGRLYCGSAEQLPFPDDSFDCVLSINAIHNLPRAGVVNALREIQRVCRSDKNYVVVDSYHSEEEKKIFESWVLTAEFHGYPAEWFEAFSEAGYVGDWSWTIV